MVKMIAAKIGRSAIPHSVLFAFCALVSDFVAAQLAFRFHDFFTHERFRTGQTEKPQSWSNERVVRNVVEILPPPPGEHTSSGGIPWNFNRSERNYSRSKRCLASSYNWPWSSEQLLNWRLFFFKSAGNFLPSRANSDLLTGFLGACWFRGFFILILFKRGTCFEGGSFLPDASNPDNNQNLKMDFSTFEVDAEPGMVISLRYFGFPVVFAGFRDQNFEWVRLIRLSHLLQLQFKINKLTLKVFL